MPRLSFVVKRKQSEYEKLAEVRRKDNPTARIPTETCFKEVLEDRLTNVLKHSIQMEKAKLTEAEAHGSAEPQYGQDHGQ